MRAWIQSQFVKLKAKSFKVSSPVLREVGASKCVLDDPWKDTENVKTKIGEVYNRCPLARIDDPKRASQTEVHFQERRFICNFKKIITFCNSQEIFWNILKLQTSTKAGRSLKAGRSAQKRIQKDWAMSSESSWPYKTLQNKTHPINGLNHKDNWLHRLQKG